MRLPITKTCMFVANYFADVMRDQTRFYPGIDAFRKNFRRNVQEYLRMFATSGVESLSAALSTPPIYLQEFKMKTDHVSCL